MEYITEKQQSKELGRRRNWRLPGANPRSLKSPTLFAGFSIWGNQWNKLMYFYPDWYRRLNLLISVYDVYRSARCIRGPIVRDGFRPYLHDYVLHVRKYVRQQAAKGIGAYGDYARFPLGRIPAFRGAVMVDSGGFSFGDPVKLKQLLKQYQRASEQSPEDSFVSSVRDFARTMLRVIEIEEGTRDSAAVTALAQEAQGINLAHQLALQADFVVTLDRVIDDYNYPLERKERRALFSLECAKAALAEKARQGSSFPSALLAVIHPVGPSLKEVKTLGVARAYRLYRSQFDFYVSQLSEAEKYLGVQFDGLGVGSLVPVQDYTLLAIIATALKHTLRTHGMMNRFLHAFGATNKKASYLFNFGFDSFDTTYHIVRAKNRFLYDSDLERYVSSSSLTTWTCSCPICSRHSLEEIRESRAGVKEVATTLHGLHNLFANHLEIIEGLGL